MKITRWCFLFPVGPRLQRAMHGTNHVGRGTSRKARGARFLDAYDVLVRRNEAISILDKVLAYRVHGKPEPRLDTRVSSGKPFGLPTNFHGQKPRRVKESSQTIGLAASLLGGSVGHPQERGLDRRVEGFDDRVQGTSAAVETQFLEQARSSQGPGKPAPRPTWLLVASR